MVIKKILLVVISIFFTILFIEIFLRIFYPQAKSESWRIQNDYGLYLNKNKGTATHEYINNEHNVHIKVNYSFGKYHNRIIKNDIYKKESKKILVLGDSVAFGWLIKDDDTFVSLLQDEFKNFYFINSAAGGLGDSDQAVFLNNYCKSINPEKILLFMVILTLFF